MTPGSVAARWRALDLPVRDGIGAAVLAVLVVVEAVTAPPAPAPAVTALVVAATVTLVRRRTRPLVPLAATTAACVVAELAGAPGAATVAVSLVAVYSAAASGARTWSAVAALVGCVTLAGTAVTRTDSDLPVTLGASVGFYAAAVAWGLAVGARRAVVDAARERAERAEATREIEASRRVAQERLRIARELHDVIGHHVAVARVQAAVAERLLTSRPDAAREALGHVQDASERVLGELGALVRVLRDPGDEAPSAPSRGLADVDTLVEEARAAGLAVELTTRGRLDDLPPVVGLAAYRVVQESLTNARKHGDGRASVAVERDARTVVVTTVNAPREGAAPTDADGSGFGLVGLHERAASLGGTLSHGVTDGRFVLRATLPTVPFAPDPEPTDGPPQEAR